ncbi:hypothetical protein M3Y97_00292400 [Aphelenchoides bicaudatus]|nr:hypothetical protein M3Y97_00292400 [Aphelenchoides bicaudatus]
MSTKGYSIPFTIEFLLDKLKNADRDVCMSNLKNYELNKLSTGQAFMSEIYQLKFKWHKENGLKSVILKIPGFQNPANSNDVDEAENFLVYAHERECDFYRFFSNPPITIDLPKFYYGYPFSQKNKDGLMILEDLSEVACTLGMIPGFNNQQVENLLVGLAKIHAASLLDRNWHDILSVEIDQALNFIAATKEMAQELREIKPEWFNTILDDMEPIYTMEYYYETMYTGTKFGIPSCVVHSDLWSANVLWKRDINGAASSQLQAIIDWQMVYSGNPAADIARTLCLNTPAKYRHENEDRLLKFYYEAFNDAMSGEIPFSLEQLKQAYIASFPYVSAVAGFGAPMYHRMTSIVGDPLNPELQHELLDRVYNFFKDTVEIIKSEK